MFSKQGQYLELRQFSLFSELNSYELNLVHNYLHKREFKDNEIIFEEGFPLEVIYFIVSGQVQINGIIVGDGTMLLKKHQFMGVIDIFGNSKRLGSAKAHKDVTLLALSKADFWELVNKNPALGVKLLHGCCQFFSKYILNFAQDRIA